MVNKARDYARTTIRRLDTLSGNECAAPSCTRGLVANDAESIVSKICHIEAANEKGPRFNASMTNEDRRGFDNLILLCDECHTIIDNKKNEEKFPVSLLKAWKKQHEDESLFRLQRRPSFLRDAVNAISEFDFEGVNLADQNTTPFSIEKKLSYNAVKRNKSLIDDYKIFYSKLNVLYAELERQGNFKKERLLRNIRLVYLKVKGKYVGDSDNEMHAIQQNADNIIDEVMETLLDSIKTSHRESSDLMDLNFGLSVIMVDAFMRCKILEEPTGDS